MSGSTHVLHSSVGPGGQGEWWRLVVDDEGRRFIEHQWSRTDPSGRGVLDAGSEWIPLDVFVSRTENPELVDRINEILAEEPPMPVGQ